MKKSIYCLIFILFTCFFLYSCGGGGGTITPDPNIQPTSAPTNTPTTLAVFTATPEPSAVPTVPPPVPTEAPVVQITPTPTSTPSPGPTNTPTNTPTPGGAVLTGTVRNLFTGASMSGVNITLEAETAGTNESGFYSISKTGTGTARMELTGSNIITRSLEVNLNLDEQDITVFPSDYNTDMFRALTKWPGYTEATMRWEEKPNFVIYTKVWDTGENVNQTYINNMTSVIQNELSTMADGFFAGSTVEIFNGLPTDDPRWKISDDWGYIDNGRDIGIAVRESFFNSSVAGKGGPVWYVSTNWLAGGGLVVRKDQQNEIDTFRHELGHSLGLSHPWTNIINQANLEFSVMNYTSTGKHSTTYSDADKKAFLSVYHRSPGNIDPDRDPNNFPGYFRIDPENVQFIVHSDPPL